jgi:uncharacterized protein
MRKCLGLAAALWLAASAGWAVDWKSLKPLGSVSDFAGVVDPASKAQLEAYAADLKRATGAQIALVTIPTLQGEPVEDVANAIARAWGVGRKGQNDGVLLLLAIHDRRSRLEIGDRLKPLLPAGLDGSIRREMRPALRAQQYGEAMMAAAETLGAAIAHARKVSLTARLPRHIRPTVANSVLWPFVIGGVLVLGSLGFLVIWAVRRAGGGRRAFRPGRSLLGSPPLVLPSGTRSGGGFGSFDSADSFGGFGGGDGTPSGPGGGASSDW